MSGIGKKELEKLADLIVQKLKEEFSVKHLSGNLINTIKVEKLGDEIKIHIPAQTYNMLLYQTKGVVVHTNNGSYASRLDEEGSEFYSYSKGVRKGSKKIKPGNHKGYVDNIINKAISEWSSMIGKNKVKIEEGIS